MNHAGAMRGNHVKIKFPVTTARNTLRELISDNHNTPIRRLAIAIRFCPELTKLTIGGGGCNGQSRKDEGKKWKRWLSTVCWFRISRNDVKSQRGINDIRDAFT